MSFDVVVQSVLLAAVAANVAIAVDFLKRVRGLARLVACVPLLGLFAVGLYIRWGISQDPTSHNLWPFEVLIACGVGIVFSHVLMACTVDRRNKTIAG